MSLQRRTFLTIAALTPTNLALTYAALAAEPSPTGALPATDPLHRFVGSWRGEVTVESGSTKPASYTQHNRFSWTLGGVFLEERGRGSNGTSFVGLWGKDGRTGRYLAHYFLAPSGDVVALSHDWVEATQTFVGRAELGGGVQMLAEDHFISADAYEWSITVQTAQGSVLSRMRGRERRERR